MKLSKLFMHFTKSHFILLSRRKKYYCNIWQKFILTKSFMNWQITLYDCQIGCESSSAIGAKNRSGKPGFVWFQCMIASGVSNFASVKKKKGKKITSTDTLFTSVDLLREFGNSFRPNQSINSLNLFGQVTERFRVRSSAEEEASFREDKCRKLTTNQMGYAKLVSRSFDSSSSQNPNRRRN